MKKILTAIVIAPLLAFAAADDGYVESDGTQYVILGHFVGPKTKIEVDFQMTEIGNVRLMGALGEHGISLSRLYIGSGKFSHITSTDENKEQGKNLYTVDLERHTAVIDFAAATDHFKILTDGQVVAHTTYDSPFSSETAKRPLAIFAENRAAGGIYTSSGSSTFSTPAKMKAYGVTIWEDGVEVKKFVPCLKGGVAGFKETHSGLFHTCEDQLNHPLAYGGNILEEKDDPYIYSPRNVLGEGQENNIFIDTGYTFLSTTRIELDYAMLTNYNSAAWPTVPYILSAGSHSPDLTKTNNLAYAATTGGAMQFRVGSSSFAAISGCPISSAHGIRRTVCINSNKCWLVTAGHTNCTVAVSASSAFSEKCTVLHRSLKIGANYAGLNYFSPMKIYGLKIYESDRLVKDYVPFVQNGKGGLKNSLDETDTLFSRTRTNYNIEPSMGTRTNVVFDVGGNIACDDGSDDAYLEFDGKNTRGHSILTDYMLTKDSRVEVDFQLWNTKPNSTTGNPAQRIFDQATANRSNCIYARLYINNAWAWSWMFADNHQTAPSGTSTVGVKNERLHFTIDSYNNSVAVTNAGVEVKKQTMTTSRTWETGVTNLFIGCSYAGNSSAASMRLYSFKIFKAGKLERNFVPCVKNDVAGLYDTCEGNFFPAIGSKVRGATLKGEEFQIAPQPAKLTRNAGGDSATVTCLAAGAISYEWYENGERMEGEDSDSLTVTWMSRQPHVRNYSVVPVYNVFNEKVKGAPVSATVEMTPIGSVVVLQ